MTDTISQQDGQLLLKLARENIADHLGQKSKRLAEIKKRCNNTAMKKSRGVFVTLHKHGQLRGCIGNIEPARPLVEGVTDNAIHAAFSDSRFSPLSLEELKDTCIEISVLTSPEKIDYTDEKDLLSKLRPHIDGVIIEKGYHKATFLPQVWSQLASAGDFLNHLCTKAGLREDEWRAGKLKVSVYQVQSFEEKNPSEQ